MHPVGFCTKALSSSFVLFSSRTLTGHVKVPILISSKSVFVNPATKIHTSPANNMSKPVLYNYFRSSASWRVRIALAYKKINYEYKAVNLLEKEQSSEEYMKVNPLAQVPAFVHNGVSITQSHKFSA